MPMLQTAMKHFQEDIERAGELISISEKLENGTGKDDVLRSAWMFAVGACDAYFCDAYGDLIARTLRAKSYEGNVKLPDKLNNLKIPIVAAITPNINEGWRWRMAARDLIEKESVLSLDEIRGLFNQFCGDGKKIANKDTIENWINHKQSKFRLFGISKTDYGMVHKPEKLD